MSLTSILTVTLNREALARQCLGPALEGCGAEYELLSVDNGSTDGVADYVASLNPIYHRRNTENLGYAPMINQMLLRAKGDFLCVLDPDLLMPANWLVHLVCLNQEVANSGLSSYHCVQTKYPEQIVNGHRIHLGPEVFGVKFFSRKILEEVGYFDEMGLYGEEDVAFNFRLKALGYLNYYVGSGHCCTHAGDDIGDKSPYRAMKWGELKKTYLVWEAKKEEYKRKEEELEVIIQQKRRQIYYVGPPEIENA